MARPIEEAPPEIRVRMQSHRLTQEQIEAGREAVRRFRAGDSTAPVLTERELVALLDRLDAAEEARGQAV